jgi:hypothetical protein
MTGDEECLDSYSAALRAPLARHDRLGRGAKQAGAVFRDHHLAAVRQIEPHRNARLAALHAAIEHRDLDRGLFGQVHKVVALAQLGLCAITESNGHPSSLKAINALPDVVYHMCAGTLFWEMRR